MQELRLLALVIGNLRDSAYGGRYAETEVELWLASELTSVIKSGLAIAGHFELAIKAYQQKGSVADCVYTTYRSSVYSNLLNSDFSASIEAPTEAIHLELELVMTGLNRISSFCSDGRFDLVYFEAHHIHNSPTRLVTRYVQGLRFYLNVEREFVCDRFENANVELELRPETVYREIWDKMEALMNNLNA
jgi:hypothetical protein